MAEQVIKLSELLIANRACKNQQKNVSCFSDNYFIYCPSPQNIYA
jgi:hypothetical protein